MSLSVSRGILNNFLFGNSSITLTSDGQWEHLIGIVRWWFSDLKAWEAADTFDAAYSGCRMTVRAISGGHQKEDSGRSIDVVKLGADNKVLGTYPVSLRSGRDGIEMRMDPSRHWKRGERDEVTWSGKYHWGLHDMNASLLNPRRPWYKLEANDKMVGKDGLIASHFGQMKPYIGGLYVFMPLPAQEDLKIFYLLQGLAKDKVDTCPDWFRESVRWIGKRLTRIKYAQERDMAVKYWDVGPKNGLDRPKIVMGGIAGKANYKNKPSDVSYAKANAADIQKRRELATEYQAILKDHVDSEYNEVIISYRSHGDENAPSRFPVYATLAKSGVGLVIDKAAREVITPQGTRSIVSQQMFDKYYQT